MRRSQPGFVSMPQGSDLSAGTFRIARPSPRRVAVSLTPLIDVVFILLIFFMLASSFMDWRSLDLGTPVQTTAAGSSEGALLVELRAGEGGVLLRLAGERLSPEELEARLRARLEQRPDQKVLLRAGSGVALQETVNLLDRLDRLGVQELALLPPTG